MKMVRKGRKMMNRWNRIFLNGLLSKPLVDVTWGETVFVAVGDMSEVEIAMYCLGDGDWEYKVLIFHL